MRIFGLGDLHLSLCQSVVPGAWQHLSEHKPMDVFGEHWHQHVEKIYRNWIDRVRPEDVVLVPGDISWAMSMEEVGFDLEFLSLLPGKIIMIQGNHDYWWQSISKVRQVLPQNVQVIQNDGVLLGDIYIAGTRGWVCPGSTGFNQHDKKIYQRELNRLALSLKYADHRARKIIAMFHFMPCNDLHDRSGFIDLLEEYGVEQCIYGHLHQGAFHLRLPEKKWGINFSLVSGDYLNFQPLLLEEEVHTS
ncbi:metallophosphoesterase [Dehalobacterium formicoaceticum]|uniref:Metallophosphoesterase n=1 Tax=Dehalobacterium formicoaceticum TaxID=51515 RepID=A0ABT1Y2H6_9FIRM|nr:metallophosphoesterase [Dehalobacterium formicoaceticum]MCR6545075.1 metallophosphoesterase [Dehalobacterium formicoaceticum]